MLREKSESPKREIKDKRIIGDSNKVKKLLDKSKIFVDKKCIGDLNLKKRVVIKDDGRYLIYYDF